MKFKPKNIHRDECKEEKASPIQYLDHIIPCIAYKESYRLIENVLMLFFIYIYTGSAELLEDVDNDKNLPLHLSIENGHLSLVEFCFEMCKKAGQ